jgi:DNA (cytosine-5)-methyltransferase 1
MLDGELWEQTMSEHLTREKEYGLLEETFPTPMASDNRDRGNISDPSIQRRIKLGKQISLTMAVKKEKGGGSLNPRWTEWLMGFPIGHTNLKPLEMDKYQKWLEQHGKY